MKMLSINEALKSIDPPTHKSLEEVKVEVGSKMD